MTMGTAVLAARYSQRSRLLTVLVVLILASCATIVLLRTESRSHIARVLPKIDAVFDTGKIYGGFVPGVPDTSPESAASKDEVNRHSSLVAQYYRHLELEASPHPLELQRYPEHATFLLSINGDEATVARMKFTNRNREPKYNPNILPYPAGSQYPYIGFARKSILGILYHHEVEYCNMQWGYTETIGRRVLRCVDNKSFDIKVPEWTTPDGLCPAQRQFLALRSGLSDPRIFFSALGEPLMIVGTNGKHNCLNQWIIDLRALIPELGERMRLGDLPIRFAEMTEMTTPNIHEVDKNYFLLHGPGSEFDVTQDFIHQDYLNRSISRLIPAEESTWDDMNFPNIANPAPELITSLLKKYSDTSKYASTLHQATNSLRVTLCDFPCIPTAHNTVIIEITHVKYKNVYELFYRRYVIVMNATAPFDVLGRTSNIMYAGTDEQTMLYTTSMVWDHPNFREHGEWDEELYGGQAVWPVSGNPSTTTSSVISPTQLVKRDTSLLSPQPTTTPLAKKMYPTNPFVSRYYHGWLDDVIAINIGINDEDAAVLHTTARKLLSCIQTV
ncbi:uncharacterized protein V1518DRAFT_439016 [Limtongia smithiae]|uniref:uncharacterized protein n=1 Tax=Limtongia smithiae TaxID=1125753 RepID=UPI0034CF51DF